jgi:hypothetical protein
MPLSRLASVVWLALCLLPLASSASPRDPRIGFELSAFPSGGVTLTSARYTTHVAYRVRVVNGARNDLNRVRFTATTSVDGAATNTSAIDPAVIVATGVAGACTQPAGVTSIECSVGASGSLKPGQAAEFWVVVRVPSAGQVLRFAGTFGGHEGKGRGNGCCDATLTVQTPLIDPVLSSADPDAAFKREFASFVGAAGGTYFTGASGFPTADDPWTTTVVVPGVSDGLFGLPFTTASVLESEDLNSCLSINSRCNRTQLTIPGTFDSLLITLRQHPSILSKHARIEQWRIAYSPNPGAVPYAEVQHCSVTGGPTLGVPCIKSCREVAPELSGYKSSRYGGHHGSYGPGVFECKIRALDNGGYKVQ